MLFAGETKPRLILVADDFEDVADTVAEVIHHATGIDTAVAHDGDEALSILLRERPQLALLDLDMPHQTGIQVAESSRWAGLPTFMIAMTGGVLADAARQSGAFDLVLMKPLDVPGLLDSLGL